MSFAVRFLFLCHALSGRAGLLSFTNLVSKVEKDESEFTERGFQPGNRFVSFVRDVRASGRGEAAGGCEAIGIRGWGCRNEHLLLLRLRPTRNGAQDLPY